MGLLLRTAGWFKAKAFGLVRRCILAVLAAGPVPRHVAFVMDGNRRYARMHRIPVTNGHRDGFAALERVLEIFMRLDIRCISVYAFSIENFKRDEAEVMALMELAEEKLHQLAAHGALLQKYRIRLNVCGRKELFPIRLQEAIKHVEDLTRNHDHAILNLCMPYTSRDEITTAVQNTVREVVDKDIDPETITEHDIASHLMTSPDLSGSPPLDILVRTSGVKRLSDFMLWQAHADTQIQFSSAYWPDFGLLDFAPILLDFQRRAWSTNSERVLKKTAPRLLDEEAESILRSTLRAQNIASGL